MKIQLREGFKGEGTPDMKYYAFDWDDNIVHMPTKIMLKNELQNYQKKHNGNLKKVFE